MKGRLRVGLVGCGAISVAHMDVYSMLSDRVEVVGLCDLDLDRARALAARYRVREAFSYHKELLERDLDFIDICTPCPTHAEIAVDSAKKGVHVLVEKPMARTSSECKRMIEEGQKNGVSLCVCHTRLFSPSVLAAGQIITRNNWEVHSCTITSKFSGIRYGKRDWATRMETGGPLWEMGAHAIYIQRHFLGETESVFAFPRRVNYPVDDRFGILLRARSGAIGIIELTYGDKRGIEVYTCSIETKTEDEINLDFTTEYVGIKKASKRRGFAVAWSTKVIEDLARFYKSRLAYASGLILAGSKIFRRPHLALMSGFVYSINSGVKPPVTGEDGLRTIEILEAIESSAEKGTPISV